MSDIHVYVVPSEPYTRFNIGATIGQTHWMRCRKRTQARCHICGRRRWAKNLRVQVYYDMVYVFCADPCKKKR